MKRFMMLSFALAFAPAGALAQVPPPPMDGPAAPSAQQMAAMQQMHAQLDAARLQTRSRLLAALTPQHRAAVANIVGQLALSPNPNTPAAAQALDGILAAAEKQSIVAIDTAARANRQTLMQQHRAAFEATLSADARAQMAQREAKMRTFMQSHARPADASDPGAIILRTLGNVGGGMREHAF